MFIEEICDGFRTDRVQFVVNGDADTLLAVAQTESAAQIDFVVQLMAGNEGLELLDHGTRSLQVAG